MRSVLPSDAAVLSRPDGVGWLEENARVDGGEDNAANGAMSEMPRRPNEEPYASAVPGCILLAIGALMVLLLAIGWLI